MMKSKAKNSAPNSDVKTTPRTPRPAAPTKSAAVGQPSSQAVAGRDQAAGTPRANGAPVAENALAKAQQSLGAVRSASGVDLTEKVKELLRLAQEQGYLTYDDIND